MAKTAAKTYLEWMIQSVSQTDMIGSQERLRDSPIRNANDPSQILINKCSDVFKDRIGSRKKLRQFADPFHDHDGNEANDEEGDEEAGRASKFERGSIAASNESVSRCDETMRSEAG